MTRRLDRIRCLRRRRFAWLPRMVKQRWIWFRFYTHTRIYVRIDMISGSRSQSVLLLVEEYWETDAQRTFRLLRGLSRECR